MMPVEKFDFLPSISPPKRTTSERRPYSYRMNITLM
ncbi:unnamed protein product [Strongylus vulgaris]|uniref:Uncharacterized protein n=1 Tax=Strongylus vulgaris TaxID=40348 RepID=A0A3P7JGK1_STRVU|nr:unnamed protein product [Strongylus vulgaris]